MKTYSTRIAALEKEIALRNRLSVVASCAYFLLVLPIAYWTHDAPSAAIDSAMGFWTCCFLLYFPCVMLLTPVDEIHLVRRLRRLQTV